MATVRDRPTLPDHPPSGLGNVALALWAQNQGRRFAAELLDAGFQVLLLKGPELQARLYGTPAAYASSDMDVLIRRSDASRARRFLRARGWTFERGNGVLWRTSAAASFVRDGFPVDLHWGLHAAHLPAWSLRSLERGLWSRATIGESGMFEPDAESLFVFLALHAAGHQFERPQWSENVSACARLVSDWDRVHAIARAARLDGIVRDALSGPHRDRGSLLDGGAGQTIWFATWLLRGHFLPETVRGRAREVISRWREGFGFVGRRRGSMHDFGGNRVFVPRGVFAPRRVTEQLLRLALELTADSDGAVVEVGTGSGALAFAFANARPDVDVYATDISYRALATARRNARRLGLERVAFHRGSLLSPLPASLRGRTAAVVSNIPYIPSRTALRLDWRAPLDAVAGPDADGLGLIRDLAREARRFLEPGGWLAFQLDRWQWDDLAPELSAMGYEPAPAEDVPRGHTTMGAARWPGSHG